MSQSQILVAQNESGNDFRSTWVLEVSAQICMVNDRDVCILKSATYALRNAELLEHMAANYPEKVDWFQERFEKSSYNATVQGRSMFRRILAENAIEVLEIYYKDFKQKNDPALSPDDLRNRIAIFHFIRAQSCADQSDEECAVTSLRIVKDAMDSGAWQEIVARFELEEPDATQQQVLLLEKYAGKL
jgi:hypothetical protein